MVTLDNITLPLTPHHHADCVGGDDDVLVWPLHWSAHHASMVASIQLVILLS